MHSPIAYAFVGVGVLCGLDCGVEAWCFKGPIPPIVAVIPKRYNRSVLLHIRNSFSLIDDLFEIEQGVTLNAMVFVVGVL